MRTGLPFLQILKRGKTLSDFSAECEAEAEVVLPNSYDVMHDKVGCLGQDQQ